MKFYNTLSRKKEIFTPINPPNVSFYSCGPTVYNYPHIGNYRAYIFADILKRALSYCGYEVKHVMNLTDVDDKTIRDAQKAGKTLKEFTEFYTKEFYKDSKFLNILPPDKFTKATDYIGEMVGIIKTLLEKELAYQSTDGSVYFNIKKFKDYGKLSGLDLKNQKENAAGRIKTDEYDKDSAQDFALWKSWDEKDGEVFWDPSTWLGAGTELGKGRPGWHIECSAMSMATLGEQIDIHTGGVDNIFPHHENEIAQSEGATGKHFVKYWMHNEWVLVDQKKMAKSEHNFYTLRNITDRGISPIAYRFWLLMANYRTRVNFVWEALEGAETALKRLFSLYSALDEKIGVVNSEYQEKFKKFIEDDLDTPRALTVLWDVLKDETLSTADKRATVLDFDKVFGLGFADLKEEIIPREIWKYVEKREKARKKKDWAESDRIRQASIAGGFNIEDTPTGPKPKKI